MGGLDNDWFMDVARDAEKSERARQARENEERARLKREEYEQAQLKLEQERAERRAKMAKSPAEVRAAAAAFGVTPEPLPPGGAQQPRADQFDPMSAEQGLQAILRHIRKAGTPDQILAAGGEWITRVTIAIGDVTRAAMPDDD